MVTQSRMYQGKINFINYWGLFVCINLLLHHMVRYAHVKDARTVLAFSISPSYFIFIGINIKKYLHFPISKNWDVTHSWTPSSRKTRTYLPTQIVPQIARFMGPTWGSSGADRTQVGPMLAPWTLLSGAGFWKPINTRMQGISCQVVDGVLLECSNVRDRQKGSKHASH